MEDKNHLSERFQKTYRLLKPTDFEYLRDSAHSLHVGGISVFYKATRVKTGCSRIAFSISKKSLSL